VAVPITARPAPELARRSIAGRSLRWKWATLALRVALAVLAAWALRRELAGLDSSALVAQLRSYGWRHASLGIAATVASFVLLGAIELLGLRYGDHGDRVPRRVGLTTGFVANAMSQSIGVALLTGSAVRIRAYRRYGLDAGDVARVSAFVTITITLGLLATGAMAFLASSAPLHLWRYALPVRPVGALLALVVIAYLGWSVMGAGKMAAPDAWRIRQPSPTLAVQQVVISAIDWVITGSILYLVLPDALGVEYATALRIYLVAQTIGSLSHVPGGAGVFEALVLASLAQAGVAERSAIVASLVMFRVLYYLLPLMAACALAALAELRRSHTSRRGPWSQ
jgi:phosphatidylglycerol lysyltransferase